MRILIAESQAKVRFALRVLLGRQPGIDLGNEASDAVEALTEAMNTCPDVVLLAWDLPGRQDLKLIPALRRICPAVKIIVLSGRAENRQAALAAGADAFVSKGDPPESLLLALARRPQKLRQQMAGHAP